MHQLHQPSAKQKYDDKQSIRRFRLKVYILTVLPQSLTRRLSASIGHTQGKFVNESDVLVQFEQD